MKSEQVDAIIKVRVEAGVNVAEAEGEEEVKAHAVIEVRVEAEVNLAEVEAEVTAVKTKLGKRVKAVKTEVEAVVAIRKTPATIKNRA